MPLAAFPVGVLRQVGCRHRNHGAREDAEIIPQSRVVGTACKPGRTTCFCPESDGLTGCRKRIPRLCWGRNLLQILRSVPEAASFGASPDRRSGLQRKPGQVPDLFSSHVPRPPVVARQAVGENNSGQARRRASGRPLPPVSPVGILPGSPHARWVQPCAAFPAHSLPWQAGRGSQVGAGAEIRPNPAANLSISDHSEIRFSDFQSIDMRLQDFFSSPQLGKIAKLCHPPVRPGNLRDSLERPPVSVSLKT